MIIECEKCHAKYRIDDSKVTPQGVKVRCKKCQHIFVVKPPEEEKGSLEDLRIEELFREEEREEVKEEKAEEEEFSWGPAMAAEGTEAAQQKEPAPPPSEAAEAAGEEVKREEEAEREVEEAPRGGEAGARPSSTRRVLLIVLLFLLLILLGLVTLGGINITNLDQWIPKLFGEKERVVKLANREFLGNLKGYYVANKKEGLIFVVEGIVENPEAVEVPLKRIRVVILDKDGKPSQERLALLGKALSREELSALSREEIEGRLKGGKLVLPPNTFLPFMTVFYHVPRDLSEFVVEVEG